MKPETHSINDVLAKNVTSFFIPPFQRAFAWGKSEIERYFSDVLRIINSELDSKQHDKLEHFFGTIVMKVEDEGFASKSVVVDGQQRLTTTLIFLIALRDLETDATKQKLITENYLTNNASTFTDKIKLKQVTKDWDAYKALVNKQEQVHGIITNAHQLFTTLINKTKNRNPEIKLEHYIKAIQRMNVAVLFLDNRPFKGEDPQIIFETLNSLGKPLSLSDLVRNFVLLNMDSKNQSNIYEKTWHPKIEKILNDNTSKFFRDYLQYKTASSIKVVSDNNTKEVYQLFKSFAEEKFETHNDFINDIVRFVNWYEWIISEIVTDKISADTKKNAEIVELLRNIFHDIKSEAFKPFVLGLLEFHQSSANGTKLSDDLLVSILSNIRTYLIRRRVLGLTQGENKNIVLLINQIGKLANQKVVMLDLLSNMFYRMRLPNDNEMKKELSSMNFYEGVTNYSKFILGKIEENNTKVAVDFRDAKITIEHIMPQTLTKSWEIELGENFTEIHKIYLHTIGNLILTEFNTEIGNKSFTDKKTKLNSSSLNFRLEVVNKDFWNEKSILDHKNNMITWFLETFSVPEKYQEKDNWNTQIIERKIFSPLDNDAGDNAEGNKPIELHIDNKVVKVKFWQDVFIEFIRFFYENQKNDFEFILENQTELFGKEDTVVKWDVLETIIDNNWDSSNRYKTFDGKVWNKVNNLDENTFFIHTNISASSCISRIANVMNKINRSEEFVKILLK